MHDRENKLKSQLKEARQPQQSDKTVPVISRAPGFMLVPYAEPQHRKKPVIVKRNKVSEPQSAASSSPKRVPGSPGSPGPGSPLVPSRYHSKEHQTITDKYFNADLITEEMQIQEYR